MEKIKEIIKNSSLCVLYLTTKDCNVCKVLRPKIKDICFAYSLVNDNYIELDDYPELKGEFSVFAAPTIILFVEGKESMRYGRSIDLYEFEQAIERFSSILSDE